MIVIMEYSFITDGGSRSQYTYVSFPVVYTPHSMELILYPRHNLFPLLLLPTTAITDVKNIPLYTYITSHQQRVEG